MNIVDILAEKMVLMSTFQVTLYCRVFQTFGVLVLAPGGISLHDTQEQLCRLKKCPQGLH